MSYQQNNINGYSTSQPMQNHRASPHLSHLEQGSLSQAGTPSPPYPVYAQLNMASNQQNNGQQRAQPTSYPSPSGYPSPSMVCYR
jgi:white-opaque regulator 2